MSTNRSDAVSIMSMVEQEERMIDYAIGKVANSLRKNKCNPTEIDMRVHVSDKVRKLLAKNLTSLSQIRDELRAIIKEADWNLYMVLSKERDTALHPDLEFNAKWYRPMKFRVPKFQRVRYSDSFPGAQNSTRRRDMHVSEVEDDGGTLTEYIAHVRDHLDHEVGLRDL